MSEIVYKASKTLGAFHRSDCLVRGIMGPIGSGKSVACSVELMRRAMAQMPFNGKRKSRWVIIRNTYRELNDTTIKTFFDWFDRDMGYFRNIDMSWTLNQKLSDGTHLEVEFIFRALDKPDDIKKLLSLELTGGWINEAKEVPKQVLDMLMGRVGRYPSMRDGGASWFGIIMDTNPPDNDHWWYTTFEEDRPENFLIWKQPSGLSSLAENIDNLPKNYYRNMISGKDQEWISVFVHGKYGFISDGRPIYPEYNDSIHSTLDDLEVYNKIYIGIDFGLTPAAVFGQITTTGQFQVIDELVSQDMGAVNFGRLLKQKMHKDYKGCEFEVYADPAGEQRAQTDETTPFQILWNIGIEAYPAPSNDFTIRREVVADYLGRLDFAGKPAFMLGPLAKVCRKGMAGGYKYKRVQVSGEQRFQDKPDKGRYSHVCDALQYLLLGAVGDDRVMGGYGRKEIDYSTTNRLIV